MNLPPRNYQRDYYYSNRIDESDKNPNSVITIGIAEDGRRAIQRPYQDKTNARASAKLWPASDSNAREFQNSLLQTANIGNQAVDLRL